MHKYGGFAAAVAFSVAALSTAAAPRVALAEEEWQGLGECYFHEPSCHDLEGAGYWSGCNDGYPNQVWEGVVTAWVAWQLCTTRHNPQ